MPLIGGHSDCFHFFPVTDYHSKQVSCVYPSHKYKYAQRPFVPC